MEHQYFYHNISPQRIYIHSAAYADRECTELIGRKFNLHNTSDSLRNRDGITCLCGRPCMVSHINEGMPKATRKDTCVLSGSLTVNNLTYFV